MHFVSASIYLKAKTLAFKEGLPPTILAHHDLKKELMGNPKYIPIDLLFEVYEAAHEYLNPGFSVRQGLKLNSDDYGTLGLSWKTCWKAKEVIDRNREIYGFDNGPW